MILPVVVFIPKTPTWAVLHHTIVDTFIECEQSYFFLEITVKLCKLGKWTKKDRGEGETGRSLILLRTWESGYIFFFGMKK